ncbi:hypothetical protein BN424_84 [Carnobacterium maltaromaticum LMA28]|uniref:Uncharacterized protein n=1 Tax=Carnobacterium maltaromaticum LMA28 TaxID=1234679 RepID=K8E1B5_CARML|nr:hypothetical protein [Carnobacterium maltaromaticum]CCO09567.2 hypothetical protein BN424_84 [Carnobacterium maltaromaticum LMA28]
MSSHFRKEYFCDWLMVNEGIIVEEDCVKESVDILLHEELPFILQSKVPAAFYHQASFQNNDHEWEMHVFLTEYTQEPLYFYVEKDKKRIEEKWAKEE